ncbi:MAG: exosome complex protein Rrp42 [Candidatus Diapherotrites archaeon]
MREEIIWELRSDKVRELAKNGERFDGRKPGEYREISITTDISQNAHGSCRVRIGKTDVITGVKLDVATPYPDSPDEGSISVGVELMPMASPVFEPGPPREDAIELARVADRGIRESKALDFKDFSIISGEKAWFAFIDCYVANDDGNLLDACALSSIGALLNTRVPKYEDEKIVKGEYEGKLKIRKKPMLCTVAKVSNILLSDPVLAEEKAMDARLSICTTDDGQMSAFQKGGAGSFTESEIDQCIDLAVENGKKLRSKFK